MTGRRQQLADEAKLAGLILKLKELSGGAELEDPGYPRYCYWGDDGPIACTKDGHSGREFLPGPGAFMDQWICVLVKIQMLCAQNEVVRHSAISQLEGLLEAHQYEATPQGRIILLLMGSVDPRSLASDGMLERLGSRKEALRVVLLSAASKPPMDRPLREIANYWETAINEPCIDGFLECRAFFRPMRSNGCLGIPSMFSNYIGPLPEKLRVVALKSWLDKSLHPSWKMGFDTMVGVTNRPSQLSAGSHGGGREDPIGPGEAARRAGSRLRHVALRHPESRR